MTIQPGDVLLTRSRKSWAARLIRFGAALLGRPNTINHVVVAHHVDAETGVFWGIEGRPGGVAWVDLGPYMRNPYTASNEAQPKTETQRAVVCEVMTALMGTPYDWAAIAGDGLRALRIHALWGEQWDGAVPGHVVCSSAADYAYERAGLLSPLPDRDCTPGDWAAFLTERRWLALA